MNYQSLIYFKMVAELQHYTRAANELYITQPALSKAIRNLECEFGTALFRKDGRNVTLTPSGKLFYEYVKRSVDEIDQGVAAVRRLADIERNTIFLSALFSMYAIYLPDKVLRFRHQNPGCRFSMEYKYTTAILQDVLKGRAELGICSDFDIKGEFSLLKKFVLYREPIGLMVGSDHRFAGRDKVGVEELRDERFIVYIRSGLGTNKIISDLCRPYGFEPNIVAEAYTDYGVFGMVSAGEGVAIIPTTGVININGVTQVALDVEAPLTREINIVWKASSSLSPMAARFRDMLQESSKQEMAEQHGG
ncbi:HTH-type transcriptional regulator GltC [bioreactor metagenome]|uniref:HTH-type transcriptional regulator GltC n=1 Tax=bioreactor metagenome TaxID=1076179 RepID=A0A644YI74_9ZZZZ